MEKQIILNRFGGPEVFELQACKIREPKDHEVAIKVKAAGVADLVMRIGMYKDAPPLPFVPGYEISGIVDKVGKNVTNLKVGDRVLSPVKFGGYASYVCLRADGIRILPDHLSFEEGASIPVNWITAYACLNEMARIRKGDHVLIHGASGGVGLAAVQLAKEKGCIVYGTAGSKDKLKFIEEFGVDYPISYREEDFVEAIRRITGKKAPLDVIMDPVGGDNVGKNISLLKPTGRTIIFGASSMHSGKRDYIKAAKTFLAMRKIDTLKLIDANRGVFGFNALNLDDKTMFNCINSIVDGFVEGKYKVVISATFPLEQASEAHKYLEDRKNIGKVILTV